MSWNEAKHWVTQRKTLNVPEIERRPPRRVIKLRSIQVVSTNIVAVNHNWIALENYHEHSLFPNNLKSHSLVDGLL